MANHNYTVEELMLDDSFINYCLKRNTSDTIKWNAIIDSDFLSEKIFAEAEQLILLLHSGISEEEVDNEWQQIRQKIHLRQANRQSGEESIVTATSLLPNRRTLYNKWLYTGIVASLLICVFLFFSNNRKQSLPHSVFTASAQPGVRKKIILPDGSEVYLNSNSRVSWDETFNQNSRRISLSGSAFFKVAKNAAKPFIVQSSVLSTTALGTEFYVQQLPSEHNIQVSLLEGKIDVEQTESNRQNIIYPGEEVIYNANSRSLQKQTFDTAILYHWLGGELSFRNMKLKDVVREIAFWYNINVKLQNASLADKLMTGNYQDAPLDDVLKVMSFSLRFTYTTSGNTVVIH